ncbi:hypothetical protein ZIOFF_020476 [Zingiber officinale]|uniref:Inhibitor I9 domain-containing protein n=1 Tax=Zingiber officinale TaxID=94328 RepID=A0A8J5L7X9_ZINOF|nr:hypothetical protein ZIOFF_020476 [Zingiber officinale]
MHDGSSSGHTAAIDINQSPFIAPPPPLLPSQPQFGSSAPQIPAPPLHHKSHIKCYHVQSTSSRWTTKSRKTQEPAIPSLSIVPATATVAGLPAKTKRRRSPNLTPATEASLYHSVPDAVRFPHAHIFPNPNPSRPRRCAASATASNDPDSRRNPTPATYYNSLTSLSVSFPLGNCDRLDVDFVEFVEYCTDAVFIWTKMLHICSIHPDQKTKFERSSAFAALPLIWHSKKKIDQLAIYVCLSLLHAHEIFDKENAAQMQYSVHKNAAQIQYSVHISNQRVFAYGTSSMGSCAIPICVVCWTTSCGLLPLDINDLIWVCRMFFSLCWTTSCGFSRAPFAVVVAISGVLLACIPLGELNYPRSFNSPVILGSSSPISDQDDSLQMPIVLIDPDSDAYATTVQLSSGDRLGALVAKLYIVYLGERKHENPVHVTNSHLNMLTCLLGSKKDALTSMVYSYKHDFSGFTAMLIEDELMNIAESPDVISVQSSRNYELQTTRSWDFLGLQYDHSTELLEKSNYGDDIIIGIIDTGLFVNSNSLDIYEHT